MSALLSVGFIPTAALADDEALSYQEATVNAIVETVDIETTEADIASDITLDEAEDPVEPATPAEDEIDLTPEYTKSDSPVNPAQDEVDTTVDSDSSNISHLAPPPPETSSLNSNFYEPETLFETSSSEDGISLDETLTTVSNLDNIASDDHSQAIARDFIYELETYQEWAGNNQWKDVPYAVIKKYIGNSRDVVIPTTLGGYPVKIQYDAFEGNRSIDTLTFSEGVTDNTDYSSFGCISLRLTDSSIKTINFPSSLSAVDILDDNNLQAINISPDNPDFCSIDGVVYNKDKTTLCYYPPNKAGATFTIPSTVTTIRRDAFQDTKQLKTLNVPDSVTTIEEYAFDECKSIETINLGKGVQNIDEVFFYLWSNYLQDIFGTYLKADHTPTYALSQIHVDQENPYFSSEDGVLYNKDKTEIISYPPSKKGESFTAPSSVKSIRSCAFHSCVYLSEIIFPGKIYYIGGIGGDTVEEFAPFSFWPLKYIVFLGGINDPEYLASDGGIGVTDTPCPIPETEDVIAKANYGLHLVGDDSVRQYADKDRYAYLSFSDYQTEKTQPKANSKWIQDSVGWWYRYADGSYPKNAWAQIGGAWYHFNKSGYMQTGWQQIGGAWYYLKPSGAMATGWTQVGGTWYYLKSSGAMATGWQQIGGAWYYLDGSGAMQTGWYKVGPKWYYSNVSGAMQTNRWIGNYYVGSSGAMATNQWVGNYYVNASGLWVR